MLPSPTPRIQVSISSWESVRPSLFFAINDFMGSVRPTRSTRPSPALWRGLEPGEGAGKKIADGNFSGSFAGAIEDHEKFGRVFEENLPARPAESDGLVASRDNREPAKLARAARQSSKQRVSLRAKREAVA